MLKGSLFVIQFTNIFFMIEYRLNAPNSFFSPNSWFLLFDSISLLFSISGHQIGISLRFFIDVIVQSFTINMVICILCLIVLISLINRFHHSKYVFFGRLCFETSLFILILNRVDLLSIFYINLLRTLVISHL